MKYYQLQEANVTILYPLKRPGNQKFSGVFRGYKMETLARNGLKKLPITDFGSHTFYAQAAKNSCLSNKRNLRLPELNINIIKIYPQMCEYISKHEQNKHLYRRI